jgi:hypothetical protein
MVERFMVVPARERAFWFGEHKDAPLAGPLT